MESLRKIKTSFFAPPFLWQTKVFVLVYTEFFFGKLIGFGLDVPVQFNVDTKKFRNEEFKGGIETVRFIRYFTLGRKKETPIYLRTGDLTGVSLGYGTLVNNYSNSPSFEARKWGVNFDFNIKGIVGVEGIYSDIKGFNMTAFRPYIRPLRPTSLPIIKTLEIGASFVSDSGKNADSTAFFLKQNVIKANPFDLGITFFNTAFATLYLYGQPTTLTP